MAADTADLIREHSKIMDQLYEEIARQRGFPSFKAIADTDRKTAVINYAARLCRQWGKSADLRRSGVGESVVLRLVADQYLLAQEIVASEARSQATGS